MVFFIHYNLLQFYLLWRTLIATKKRRKRSNNQDKLGYFVIHNLDKNGIPLDDPIEYIEDKNWKDISGHDLSSLIKIGWRTEKLMTHFGVTRLAIIQKIRLDWNFRA